MGWLEKLFKGKQKNPSANYNLDVSMKGYEPYFSPIVSEALYTDIIYSAMAMKARYFGKLIPQHVRKKGEISETIDDSSIARILRNPNDFQTPYDFLTQAYFMREKDNNCFIFPDYRESTEKQRIYLGMYILLPVQTPLIMQDESGELWIQFTFVNPDRQVVFRYKDIIVWRKNWEDNQFLGGGRYSKLSGADLLTSINAYKDSKEAVAEAAKLGCYLDGIVKITSFVADNEKTKKIRDEFIEDLRSKKSGIGVLDNGAEFQSIQRSLKMVDSATLAEIKQNVMLHTGLTIDMLCGKMTETEREVFFENHIQPAGISLAQAMSKCFFSQWQTSYGDRVEIYPNKIALMSVEQRIRVAQTTIPAGVFTIDEYRDMFGYAPLPGDEGKARPRGYNNLDGSTPANPTEQKSSSHDVNINFRFNENHGDDGKFTDGDGNHGTDPKGSNAKVKPVTYEGKTYDKIT